MCNRSLQKMTNHFQDTLLFGLTFRRRFWAAEASVAHRAVVRSLRTNVVSDSRIGGSAECTSRACMAPRHTSTSCVRQQVPWLPSKEKGSSVGNLHLWSIFVGMSSTRTSRAPICCLQRSKKINVLTCLSFSVCFNCMHHTNTQMATELCVSYVWLSIFDAERYNDRFWSNGTLDAVFTWLLFIRILSRVTIITTANDDHEKTVNHVHH